MNPISEIQFGGNFVVNAPPQQKEVSTASFKDTLSQFLEEVNDLQVDAKESVERALNGEITDIHEVMVAAEKASIGLELTLAVRNKLLDAYREIMRMSG